MGGAQVKILTKQVENKLQTAFYKTGPLNLLLLKQLTLPSLYLLYRGTQFVMGKVTNLASMIPVG